MLPSGAYPTNTPSYNTVSRRPSLRPVPSESLLCMHPNVPVPITQHRYSFSGYFNSIKVRDARRKFDNF